ncbi:MAG: FkbM family methyltransferase [Schwartzia sp.]|nr:FkbM family methyltransferase [Schwartzia sp. (in: firmicutes)]
MRLESYANSLEDMILYATLRDVPKGFYIDIGANDPTNNSVTRFFYDRGWNGINVEPQPIYCRWFDESRPRDITLCVGCGCQRGRMPLLGNGELATFSDEIANKGGFRQMKSDDTVEILTLTDIYEQYCDPFRPVHFCKIDVEGFEKEVLEGIEDWEDFRP